MLTITITGIDAVLRRLGKNAEPVLSLSIYNDFVVPLREMIRDKAPIKTGQLQSSIRDETKGTFEWEIWEGVPQGKWVREGTSPHPIFPLRPAYALWWENMRNGGHPVAMVNHPGITNPKDYPNEALAEGSARLQAGLDRIMEGLLRFYSEG